MRSTVRMAGVLIAGAIGLLFLFASGASADITDPFEPYQPKDSYMPATPPPAEEPAASPTPAEPPAPAAAPAEEPVEAPAPAPEPEPAPLSSIPQMTPVPESIVTRAPTVAIRPEAAVPVAEVSGVGAPIAQARQILGSGVERVESFIGQVVEACKIGVGTGTGVPLLVLAVLSGMVAMTSQRFVRPCGLADEDLPELLYAGDLVAPG